MSSQTSTLHDRLNAMDTHHTHHLCPRCFPYVDLYCEICQGHGEYPVSCTGQNS